MATSVSSWRPTSAGAAPARLNRPEAPEHRVIVVGDRPFAPRLVRPAWAQVCQGVHTGVMAREWELEPGQDELVKEDKASANIKRAFKRSKNDRPKDEALYTDRGGESKRGRQMRKKDPVKGTSGDKAKGAFATLKQMWSEAVADAERKQQPRRAKRK